MNGKQNQSTLRTARSVCVALLTCCLLVGCQTNQYMLAHLRTWSAPTPPHRSSPQAEQQPAKLAMTEWLEKSLNNEYHVIYGEFAWAQRGFDDEVAMGTKAGRYLEKTLHAVPQPVTETEGEYRAMLWRQERGANGSPTYIAFVIARNPTPEMGERRLLGFLELIPSDQLPPAIVCCRSR